MIRNQMRNLIQNHTQNHLINFWIKAFHYVFKKNQSLSDEFFLLSRQNLDFKHSLDTKLSLKDNQKKIFKDYIVQNLDR